MLDYFSKLPDLYIFLTLMAITTAISLISIMISKFFILKKLRYKDNATIGSISSLIGIIYGVLVGFMALYLVNNNDHASNAVQREANAAANVYRESQWLQEPARMNIKMELIHYIHHTIDTEWPLMRQGKDIDQTGNNYIDHISAGLKKYPLKTQSDILIMRGLIEETKNLYDARQERIAWSAFELSPELWEVILMGTILIIGINYAFRVNFYLHLFAISAFAIMAASMLFLLITLDRPFQGEFIIEPDALHAVLSVMS